MPPILNIIHLPQRDDRLQSFMEQMNEQVIAYKVWAGIYNKHRPYIGIANAHQQIVRYAKDNKLPYVIIAEDDIRFSCAGAWRYYLYKMPKSFDLYCGLIYSGKVDNDGRIIKGMSGTNTLYTVHERFYDFFLSPNNAKGHLDRELGKFALLYEYYVCQPMVCTQMGGYSDNLRRKVYYDEYLIGKKLFGQ